MARRYDKRFRGLGRLDNAWIRRCLLVLLREAGGGRLPPMVIDAPAGTGRFTDRLRAAECAVVHLDLSVEMLAEARRKHGSGAYLVGDVLRPPLVAPPDAVVISFRFLQHFDAAGRVEALRGLARIARRAVVAYYPGWHYKMYLRRLRRRLGLPYRVIREHIPRNQVQAEVEAAGWRLLRLRRTLPLLSENVLLLLERAG
ncbi:MAG: class I SAM-dependent methyltransferase [Planctomycetota bacterium]|nr:MAG: class I SAM-dependent methyltransferase [Planctomycetota bacterium]